ncbi:hypothetical protein ACHAXS_012608 [Conticribra weissflogii]
MHFSPAISKQEMLELPRMHFRRKRTVHVWTHTSKIFRKFSKMIKLSHPNAAALSPPDEAASINSALYRDVVPMTRYPLNFAICAVHWAVPLPTP